MGQNSDRTAARVCIGAPSAKNKAGSRGCAKRENVSFPCARVRGRLFARAAGPHTQARQTQERFSPKDRVTIISYLPAVFVTAFVLAAALLLGLIH